MLSATLVRVHCWLVPPLDGHWMMSAPFAVEPLATSMTMELLGLVSVWIPAVGSPLPAVQVPAAASRDQVGYWPTFTVVPLMVIGSQISFEEPRSAVFQRSPAYM